jgi:hypothetical protein
VSPISKRVLRAALLAAALVAIVVPVAAPTAGAAAPCWKRLINDWYDGTIDKTLPIPCYRQAIPQLPTDVRLYSSARDDILRALQQAQAAQNPPPTTAPTTTTEPPPATTAQTTTQSSSVPPATTTTPPTTTAPATTPGRPKKKGVPGAIDKLNPGDADSFPLPLRILGGLAILLVAAGIGGMIWRRHQAGGPEIP